MRGSIQGPVGHAARRARVSFCFMKLRRFRGVFHWWMGGGVDSQKKAPRPWQ